MAASAWAAGAAAVVLALVIGLTTVDADGSRTETKSYVMSPQHALIVDHPAAPVGLGAVRFDILEGETHVSVSIADAAGALQDVEAWAAFSQDAPIRLEVHFCDSFSRAIPDGMTTLRVFVDDSPFEVDDDYTFCGDGSGATTGTVTARFT